MSSRDPASALPRAAQDKDESKQEDQLIESALPSGGTAFSLADEATSGGQPITGFSVARVPIAVLNQLSEQSSMLQELQQHVKNQENTIAAMKRSVRTFSHESVTKGELELILDAAIRDKDRFDAHGTSARRTAADVAVLMSDIDDLRDWANSKLRTKAELTTVHKVMGDTAAKAAKASERFELIVDDIRINLARHRQNDADVARRLNEHAAALEALDVKLKDRSPEGIMKILTALAKRTLSLEKRLAEAERRENAQTLKLEHMVAQQVREQVQQLNLTAMRRGSLESMSDVESDIESRRNSAPAAKAPAPAPSGQAAAPAAPPAPKEEAVDPETDDEGKSLTPSAPGTPISRDEAQLRRAIGLHKTNITAKQTASLKVCVGRLCDWLDDHVGALEVATQRMNQRQADQEEGNRVNQELARSAIDTVERQKRDVHLLLQERAEAVRRRQSKDHMTLEERVAAIDARGEKSAETVARLETTVNGMRRGMRLAEKMATSSASKVQQALQYTKQQVEHALRKQHRRMSDVQQELQKQVSQLHVVDQPLSQDGSQLLESLSQDHTDSLAQMSIDSTVTAGSSPPRSKAASESRQPTTTSAASMPKRPQLVTQSSMDSVINLDATATLLQPSPVASDELDAWNDDHADHQPVTTKSKGKSHSHRKSSRPKATTSSGPSIRKATKPSGTTKGLHRTAMASQHEVAADESSSSEEDEPQRFTPIQQPPRQPERRVSTHSSSGQPTQASSVQPYVNPAPETGSVMGSATSRRASAGSAVSDLGSGNVNLKDVKEWAVAYYAPMVGGGGGDEGGGGKVQALAMDVMNVRQRLEQHITMVASLLTDFRAENAALHDEMQRTHWLIREQLITVQQQRSDMSQAMSLTRAGTGRKDTQSSLRQSLHPDYNSRRGVTKSFATRSGNKLGISRGATQSSTSLPRLRSPAP